MNLDTFAVNKEQVNIAEKVNSFRRWMTALGRKLVSLIKPAEIMYPNYSSEVTLAQRAQTLFRVASGERHYWRL